MREKLKLCHVLVVLQIFSLSTKQAYLGNIFVITMADLNRKPRCVS